MTRFTLNESEMEALYRQDPEKKKDGGFQGLIVGLQESCDQTTGNIEVTDEQRARIKMYAFKYKKGGWEDQLLAVFSRHLGAKLDKEQ